MSQRAVFELHNSLKAKIIKGVLTGFVVAMVICYGHLCQSLHRIHGASLIIILLVLVVLLFEMLHPNVVNQGISGKFLF